MNRFGIVIVTYNSGVEIGACLDACLKKTQPTAIVVVDNSSEDETCRKVRERPGVRLIANQTNEGFAAGVNRGIRSLDAANILLLNPDVQLMTDVEPLLECCSCKNVAAAAGKLEDERGRFQAGFAIRRFPTPGALALEVLGVNRVWPGNPVNRRYRCLDLDPGASGDVEQPAGAFLMVRRDIWQELGGFDEAFRPLWFEDVDFLKRARDRGYRICYRPSVVGRHKGGHSLNTVSWGCRQVSWYGSLLRYACKHFSIRGRWGVSLAAVVGFTVRVVLRIFRECSLRPIGVWVRVVRLAGAPSAGR